MSEYHHQEETNQQMQEFWNRIENMKKVDAVKTSEQQRQHKEIRFCNEKVNQVIAPCAVAGLIVSFLSVVSYGSDGSAMLSGLALCILLLGSAIPMLSSPGSFGMLQGSNWQIALGIVTIACLVFAGAFMAISLAGDVVALISMSGILLVATIAWFESFSSALRKIFS